MTRWLLAAATAVVFAAPAYSWNPLIVRPAGSNRWSTAGPVVWNADGGPLGQLSNAAAVAMVAEELGKWEAVSTATIAYAPGPQIVNGSGTSVDVSLEDYFEIIGLLANGQNPVVFDNQREIFDALGQPAGVLGFAGILRASGGEILKGYAVLQGDCFDGDATDVCGETPEAGFRGMLVHELGHFSGLGHSSVNRELIGAGLAGCPPPTPSQIETMSPTLTEGALTLHRDDVVGISTLYPAPAFDASFAEIRGALIDRDGAAAFDGANIVIRPDVADCDARYEQAQATQSGVNPGETGGPGSYAFGGLAPDAEYAVLAEAIGGGGGFPIGGTSPPALNAPDDHYNGPLEAHFDPPDDPTELVGVPSGPAGGTVSGIDIRLNNAGGPAEIPADATGAIRVGKLEGALPAVLWGLDDGTINNVSGFFGTTQMAWINRFTPLPTELPFRLERIDVYFWHPSAAIGRPIRLLVYTDPSSSGDPAQATLTYSEDRTILGLNQFNEYALSTTVTVASGDLYVGVYDLVADAADTFIAAYDSDTASSRSYRQADGTSPDGFILESGGNDKAWGIRAFGSTIAPPGTVTLTWGAPCNAAEVPDQDFAIYEGSLTSLGGVPDHTPIACSTARTAGFTVLGAGAGRFWLVSPVLATREGSPGTGTAGMDRTPTATCAPLAPDPCP